MLYRGVVVKTQSLQDFKPLRGLLGNISKFQSKNHSQKSVRNLLLLLTYLLEATESHGTFHLFENANNKHGNQFGQCELYQYESS